MDMNGFSHTLAVENEWIVVEGSSDFACRRWKEREEMPEHNSPSLSLSLSLSLCVSRGDT